MKDSDVLRWFDELLSQSNPAFMPLFFDKHRYLVLKGGGGSGKSIFAGRKVLERVTTEPGHRWLVCRKVARTLRESCFAQLAGQCAKHYPESGYHLNRTEMRISFKNGSEILFAGLDDVEKLKSIYDITGIWIEEASELAQSDFNQLDIRLRANFDHYEDERKGKKQASLPRGVDVCLLADTGRAGAAGRYRRELERRAHGYYLRFA